MYFNFIRKLYYSIFSEIIVVRCIFRKCILSILKRKGGANVDFSSNFGVQLTALHFK